MQFRPLSSAAHLLATEPKFLPIDERGPLDIESPEGHCTPVRLCLPKFRTFMWIITNVLSTVLIVFTNKSIFSHESFRNCQMAFTSYHFSVTAITLYIMSRPSVGAFTAKSLSIPQTLLPAGLMCLQIVFQNVSLAYSSVIFHQLVRLLLTPATALCNLVLFQSLIPRTTIIPLVIMCLGVGVVVYFDSVANADNSKMTSPTGAFAAVTGLCASAVYTTIVGSYHKKFEVTSMQLLLNQAALGSLMLLCFVPFFDTLPRLDDISTSLALSILLSGICAFLVNLSMFYVIDATGPVSSTVIGHLKNSIVIALGWVLSDQIISRQSLGGIAMALIGMT
ncbi:hypothetical protein N7468_006247, partial [Penicillium chermesinum]